MVFNGEGEKARQRHSGLTWAWGGDGQSQRMTGGSGETHERDTLGVFTELQAELAEWSYVSAGVRYDESDDFGEHISVRVASAAIRSLDSGDTIKYRASRMLR